MRKFIVLFGLVFLGTWLFSSCSDTGTVEPELRLPQGMTPSDLDFFSVDTLDEIVTVSIKDSLEEDLSNCEIGLKISWTAGADTGVDVFEPYLLYDGLMYSKSYRASIEELQALIDRNKQLNIRLGRSNDKVLDAVDLLSTKLGTLWDEIDGIELISKEGVRQVYSITDLNIPGFLPTRIASGVFLKDASGDMWTFSDSANYTRTRSFLSGLSLTLNVLDDQGDVLLEYRIDEVCLKTRFQKVFDLYVRMNAHRSSAD
jgi:hypothetical protein